MITDEAIYSFSTDAQRKRDVRFTDEEQAECSWGKISLKPRRCQPRQPPEALWSNSSSVFGQKWRQSPSHRSDHLRGPFLKRWATIANMPLRLVACGVRGIRGTEGVDWGEFFYPNAILLWVLVHNWTSCHGATSSIADFFTSFQSQFSPLNTLTWKTCS